ncbi:MAG: ribonuclease P protein component [Alistipes sp.]|jgi:ribonuclease P protein component|nr:ribonuclease P protein component [Alistipes sp.]
MTAHTLPKSERLRSLGAVRRLFSDGRSGFVYPFRYMIFTEESASPTIEVLFSVPKRYHKRANKRNLLRRRTKEAYRLNKEVVTNIATERGKALDMALVYSVKELVPYKTIENAVRRILQEVGSNM